jgi:hypothetical protein
VFVYFIKQADTRHIKIGRATDPKRRLAGLQTGSSFELSLLGVFKEVPGRLEGDFHSQFESVHLRGEWFVEEGPLEEFIKENASAFESSLKDLARDRTQAELDSAVSDLREFHRSSASKFALHRQVLKTTLHRVADAHRDISLVLATISSLSQQGRLDGNAHRELRSSVRRVYARFFGSHHHAHSDAHMNTDALDGHDFTSLLVSCWRSAGMERGQYESATCSCFAGTHWFRTIPARLSRELKLKAKEAANG